MREVAGEIPFRVSESSTELLGFGLSKSEPLEGFK